jgi:pre-rRNA-processing protein TSR3
MRSSGSTRSPPSRPIRLGVVVVGDDHARLCTGRRLVRLGLAREVGRSSARSDGPIVLDPYATVPLSAADRPRAEADGLVAVDCSWNRLAASRSRGPPPGGPRAHARRLPILVATNPQHFGRLGELNTAEALAAALWVVGRQGDARRLLAGFAGGPAFLEVNAERLDRYGRARTADEVVRAERALFGGG